MAHFLHTDFDFKISFVLELQNVKIYRFKLRKKVRRRLIVDGFVRINWEFCVVYIMLYVK